MRTLLAASTVTPGRTAPDVSRAAPASDARAYATAGNRNERERLLICLRYIHILCLPSRTPGAGGLACTQSSQALASPGRGGVTVSGNKPGSYPAVLVFSAPKRGDSRAGVAVSTTGFRDTSQLVNRTATSEDRRYAFSFANASSIGLKSGLYGGRNRRWATLPSPHSLRRVSISSNVNRIRWVPIGTLCDTGTKVVQS
jgi:hypothetical protein